MKWIGLAAAALVASMMAVPASAADRPKDVGLPSDTLKLDYACMARLWSEWQDISNDFESDYSQEALEDAIGPWSDDAAQRTGRTPEEVAAGPEVKAEVGGLVDLVEQGKFAGQLAFCVANEPEAD